MQLVNFEGEWEDASCDIEASVRVLSVLWFRYWVFGVMDDSTGLDGFPEEL